MARTMKSIDAVVVGLGWTGSIMARELTKAGLSVIALERSAHRTPGEDFRLPRIRDELKYRVRQELMLDAAVETVTMRHAPSETALPIRRWTPSRWAMALAAAVPTGTATPGVSRRASSCCARISPAATAGMPFRTI
jgi:choline dehydrogenase-like flavoprotein